MILNVVQGTPLITWLMWKNLHMPSKLLGFSPHGDGRFVNRTSRRSGKLMAWRSSYEVRSWHPTPVACRAGWFHPWPPGYTAASGPAPQALGMCVRCVTISTGIWILGGSPSWWSVRFLCWIGSVGFKFGIPSVPLGAKPPDLGELVLDMTKCVVPRVFRHPI